MSLEDLIYKWMTGKEEIAGQMSAYDQGPAIFMQSAPSDTQQEWRRCIQYHRIVYAVDMSADIERKSSGVLHIDLYCDAAGTLPEMIEPHIRAAFKDLVMKPAGGSPYCFVWSRREGFEIESNNSDKRIIGYGLVFDILEYPNQITTDPDPVEAMNYALKSAFPDLRILWHDEIDEFTVATNEHPIVYVRAVNHSVDHMTYALTWMNCLISIHVICPEADARLKWTRTISTFLSVAGETKMLDGSLILFMGHTVRNVTDYLINGQIELNALYSLARLRTEGNVLRHANLK